MIIFCEECGTKNDLNKIQGKQLNNKFICSHCSEPLRLVPARDLTQQLKLSFQNKDWEMNENRSVLVIGRKKGSDIRLKDKAVSRVHAYVVLKKDKFILMDQSTNGTYVQVETKKEEYISKDEIPLVGQGVFSPAYEVKEDSPTLIHYEIVRKL